MTTQEIVSTLSEMALAIMHNKEFVGKVDKANARADELETATRYLICCAILTNEVPFSKISEWANQSPNQ